MRTSPRRMTTSQNQGSSLETRPSPEISSRAMKTRPFKKLVGGHDATIDPLYNEDSASPRSQVAQNTPDLMKRQGTTNPAAGSTRNTQKLSSGPGGGVAQHNNAFRPSSSQKTSGSTMNVQGRSLAMKRKLRTAFGQGGMKIPQQSNQTRTTLGKGYQGGPSRVGGGRIDRPLSVRASSDRTPKSYPSGRSGGKWQGSLGRNQTKATVSKTSIRPNQSARRNV